MVLIVEDDATTRELYADILRDAGLMCVATATPGQALELVRTQRFDAVVLDIGLPRISDGLRLALQLRSLPEAPPMVASTGHMLEPWTAKLFHEMLHKPADMDQLVAAVRAAIARGAQPPLPFPGATQEDHHAGLDRRPAR